MQTQGACKFSDPLAAKTPCNDSASRIYFDAIGGVSGGVVPTGIVGASRVQVK